ncbi:MAG TPA: hypothetical protein VKB78_03525, partial [Pirellulales bacterium]|nr:hypothetical protein [Pirellulales bacterium]
LRGYTASPVLGTPEGIAVYQNGVRVNEPFGDIVLWDFVPTFAIGNLEDIPGSNPMFGLNALGGAVSLTMKNGFDFSGSQADLSGGSFGRARAIAETGQHWDDVAFYEGISAGHEDGWRQNSPSDLLQSFTDFAYRGEALTLGLSVTAAGSNLNGNGANPAQDDRRAAFAVPDSERNRLAFVQGRGSYQASDALSLRGTAYFRYAAIKTTNGQASGFATCGAFLCDDDGPLTRLNGAPILASTPGTGTIPTQTTRSDGGGGSLQATYQNTVAGLANTAILGGSFDYGHSYFDEVTWLGTLQYLSPPGTLTNSDGIPLGGEDYNVRLDAENRYYGLYFTDTLSITDALSVTAAGRYNFARINLADRFGDSLNGDHSYSRF